MGADVSRADVPVMTLDGDIDENDGIDAGFAADVSEQQEVAAEMAQAAAASLNMGHESTPPSKGFTIKAAEGEPLAASLDEYKMEKEVLGEGAFGKVRLATSVKNGHQVAVKIIKRNKLDKRAEELLQREVKHHEKLRHANIVRLHTWIKTPNKYYLVMEYCAEGDLLNHLNKVGTLPDAACRGFFKGMMDGIAFCHGLGIHHRDIKLENLMLGGDSLTVKIADFGLSDLIAHPGDLSGTAAC